MLLAGRKLTAIEAYQIGLVSQVFWPTSLMQEVTPRVHHMSTYSTKVILSMHTDATNTERLSHNISAQFFLYNVNYFRGKYKSSPLQYLKFEFFTPFMILCFRH